MADEKQGKRLNVCSPDLTDPIEERLRFVKILDNYPEMVEERNHNDIA